MKNYEITINFESRVEGGLTGESEESDGNQKQNQSTILEAASHEEEGDGDKGKSSIQTPVTD